MRETSKFGSRITRGFKKATAGTLAALMVVTALPANGLGSVTVEAANAVETEAVFRSYNPNNGEHLYTIDGAEHSANVGRGYKEESTEAWLAPKTSSTGVWRVYNPNSGEHLLVPESEANGLAQIGWNNEGRKMYSDDEKGVPIYRVYNKNATDAGAHHYCSKEEGAALVAAGWAWDNNGEPMIYGVDKNAEAAIESVALDNTTPKVGDTITAVTTPSKVSGVSYKWFSGTDKNSIVNEITGETDKELKVTSAMKDNYIKVVATDKDGNSAEAATTEVVATTELSLKSVEDASGGTGNVVIAYFSEAVGDLTTTDIQIRRVSDDQMFPIEKVVMSSDKKAATITLNSSDATIAATLAANTDYNLIVSSTAGTASKVFSIPAVLSDVAITDINDDDRTIQVSKYSDAVGSGATTDQTLTMPESIDVDFEEILGRTATVKYDKSNIITSFNLADEKVVYGAFKVNNVASTPNDGCLEDLTTGKKYKSQKWVSGKSEIHETSRIDRDNKGTVTFNAVAQDFDDNTGATYVDGDGIAWAKLVLNSSGTVKVLEVEEVWGAGATVSKTSNILVTKVNGNTVLGGTTEVDMKDYVILKDGKTIKVADIEAGDVVFYNTTHKFAEVYNNSKTGALKAVYSARFAFEGKTYDEDNGTAGNGKLQYKSRYIKSGEGLEDVDDDYMTALKEGKKDITVYFNRAGQPVYVTGELGEVKTSEVAVVLTEDSATYSQSLVDYLRIKGFNGDAVKTYDIDVSNLEHVTMITGVKHRKGYNNQADNGNDPAKNDNSKGFEAKNDGNWATGSGTLNHKAAAGYNGGAGDGTAIEMLTAGATGHLREGSYVTLTLNDKNEVIGINLEDMTATGYLSTEGDGTNFANTPYTAERAVAPAQIVKELTTIKAGAKTYQLSGSTPVYICDFENDSVRKITYSEYASQIAAARIGVVSYDDKDVTALFVDKKAVAGNGDGAKKIEGVVAGVEHNAGSDNYMTEITIVSGNAGNVGDEYSTTYDKFATDDIDTAKAIEIGDIVEIEVAADGKTINDVVERDAAPEFYGSQMITLKSNEKQTFNAAFTAADLAFATSTPATLTQVVAGEVKCIDFATFITESEKYVVSVSMLGESAAYVDTVVVTETTYDADDYVAAKTAIDTYIATAPNFTTLYGAAQIGTDGTNTINTKAAVLEEIARAAKIPTTVKTALAGLDPALTIDVSDVTVEVLDDGFTAAGPNSTGSQGSFKYNVTITKNGYSATLKNTDGKIAKISD